MNGRPSARSLTVIRGDECWRGQFFAMASPCEVLCKVENAAEAERLASLAAAEVWRIEDKFSRYLPDNIVADINAAAGDPVLLDPETARLIDFAATLHTLSDGKFDVTSGVLRRVWRFDGGSTLPTKRATARVLESVGWTKARWSPPWLRLLPGMEIDFGGIAKEYAVDRATDLLRAATDAACLVNLGGDLAVTGGSADNRAWKIGIEAQNTRTSLPANMLDLRTGALATSGDARRFILKDGVRYSHLLDARNGWPVKNAPRSVTVAADTCTQAGMLSTLAMLEGRKAEAFLDAQNVQYWCDRKPRPSRELAL
jgi:thiamine biosynthesis lipoprotein